MAFFIWFRKWFFPFYSRRARLGKQKRLADSSAEAYRGVRTLPQVYARLDELEREMLTLLTGRFCRSICITFCTLVVWASLYEQSLFNQQAYDNELAAQPIHSVAAIAEKPDANPNHIYTYENGSSDIDACAEPRQQRPNIDKVHKSNNTNGCTLELLPISPENNNGNLGNNNRNIYRLNNNNKANNGNNNHNGNNCTPLRPADEAIAADNKMMQTGAVATAAAAAAAAVTTTPTTGPTQRNGSTAYVAKAIDSHITDGLSECEITNIFLPTLCGCIPFATVCGHYCRDGISYFRVWAGALFDRRKLKRLFAISLVWVIFGFRLLCSHSQYFKHTHAHTYTHIQIEMF